MSTPAERVHDATRRLLTLLEEGESTTPEAIALRAELAPNGEKLVGFVGRLAHEKQVGDLRVLSDLPGTRLVVIGSGPLREQLERELPGAHFAGFQGGEDLARHVASLDLFVHPGESDTFGQTLQEAMASGVPVVAVGRGGPLDIVDASRTGWLYPPGELDESKIRAFISAPDQGVNYARGTWHHPLLCLQHPGRFLVVDRGGEGHNCDEQLLKQPLNVLNLR